MTLKEKYHKQYSDSRWIVKKNEILNRDNCMCTRCKSFGHLRVHHLVYRTDTDLWLVDNDDLVTMCEECEKEYNLAVPTTPYMKFTDKSFSPLNYYLKSNFIEKYVESLPTNGDVPKSKTIDFIESNRNLQAFENFLLKLFAGDYEPKEVPQKRMCDYDIDNIVDDAFKDSKGYDWLNED
jgi:hypothetical protein